MTPKDKAEELYSKMYGETPVRAIIAEIEQDKQCAKQCALIAVDELFNETDTVYPSLRKLYWRNVKLEIEKL